MDLWPRARALELAARINTRRLSFAETFHLLRRGLRRHVTGRRTPLWIMIGVTSACPCECEHCASHELGEPAVREPELSMDELRDLIDQADRLGVIKLVLFGGEPLAREGCIELVRHGRNLGLLVSLDTNGVLLDKATMLQLERAGLTELQVSLDSAEEARHDRLRGRPGTFRRACQAIRLAVRAGIPVVVSTYAAPRAVDAGELERIVDLARRLEATAVRIVQPISAGRWLRDTGHLLNPAQESRVRSLLDPTFVYADDQKGAYRVCAAFIRDFLHVTPRGEIQPCCYIPITFGSIRREPLSVIWSRMAAHPMYDLPKNDCPMNRPDFRRRYVDPVPFERTSPFPAEEIP